MARDPRRIGAMIGALLDYWTLNPDLRLGQIVGNMADGDTDPYYIEDDEMLARIRNATSLQLLDSEPRP